MAYGVVDSAYSAADLLGLAEMAPDTVGGCSCPLGPAVCVPVSPAIPAGLPHETRQESTCEEA